MSETKQPYKWYWAYEESGIDNKIFLFDTLDEARDHAIKKGEFDEISCKDSMIEHEENLFFEICENDLENYSNLQFTNQKGATL
jgi:hypothetical protein